MINGKKVAVVVPSYNEAEQIGMVIETMPNFVDRIIIVNDCSKDNMGEVVQSYINDTKYNETSVGIIDSTKSDFVIDKYNYLYADKVIHDQNKAEKVLFNPSKIFNLQPDNDRIILINHTVNGGVGAAISTGYKWCKDNDIDCTAVMAGDGQMDPGELEGLCLPVINEDVDYVKGNRLKHASSWLVIPKTRFFGNSALSMMNKLASGYWNISDTQTGYTTISNRALNKIRIHNIYKSYGMPNDLLVKLNIADCSIREITIKPVYNVGEESKMKVFKVIPRVSYLLLKSFYKRLWIKYFLKDFHPIFLLYNLSMILGVIQLPYLYKIIKSFITASKLSYEPLLAFLFLSVFSFFSFIFAMWMDIQANQKLYK